MGGRHVPAVLLSEKEICTICTGGWVGLGADRPINIRGTYAKLNPRV